MSKTFDPKQTKTVVSGREPLKYIQDGEGFDGSGKHLGKVDAKGELKVSTPKAKASVQTTIAAD